MGNGKDPIKAKANENLQIISSELQKKINLDTEFKSQ